MLVVLRVSFGRYIEYSAQRRKRVTAGELDRLRIIRVSDFFLVLITLFWEKRCQIVLPCLQTKEKGPEI